MGKPCPNCGSLNVERYCCACGQKNIDMHATLPALVGEVVEDALGVDSRIAHTVRPFLLRPGFLTREFTSGKRSHYTSPFKLYLVTSAIYFLVSSLFPSFTHGLGSFLVQQGAALHAADAGAPSADVAREEERVLTELHQKGGYFAKYVDQARRLKDEGAAGVAARAAVRDRTASLVPKALFALVPVAAFFLWLAYRKREKLYVNHLVFALHVHAFLFTLAILVLPLPPLWRAPLTSVLAIAYVFRALRFVHAESALRTAGKLTLVLALYGSTTLLTIGAVVLSELFFF